MLRMTIIRFHNASIRRYIKDIEINANDITKGNGNGLSTLFFRLWRFCTSNIIYGADSSRHRIGPQPVAIGGANRRTTGRYWHLARAGERRKQKIAVGRA